MYGVTFGDIYSGDLGLILVKDGCTIGTPETKRNTVDVAGRNGTLDLSVKPIRYRNRKIVLTFKCRTNVKDWDMHMSDILNAIHGKQLAVILDSDPAYYWDAFVTVDSAQRSVYSGTVQISCDAYPYKYSRDETVHTLTATSTAQEITLVNDEMSVIPTFVVDGNVTVTVKGNTYTMTQGTHDVPEIVLSGGKTTLTIKGTGKVTIKYRMGRL